ncbi:unnamed protein product [Cuscuta europaea]|uniref:Uncharacterized protein n=1 Tax=Cuscuta europaea TaxID=41803 RepID=A0A9P1E1Z1_CUSEU|nr:unnamed protein product [Cuscuta europaea]
MPRKDEQGSGMSSSTQIVEGKRNKKNTPYSIRSNLFQLKNLEDGIWYPKCNYYGQMINIEAGCMPKEKTFRARLVARKSADLADSAEIYKVLAEVVALSDSADLRKKYF